MIRVLVILLVVSVVSCSQKVENTAGQVFDNANSAIKTGADPIWMNPDDPQDN